MIQLQMESLLHIFGKYSDRVKEGVELSRYTSARVGGKADYFIEAFSADELGDIVSSLWEAQEQFTLLGGGSNVLISDKGIRGIVVLNRAKSVHYQIEEEPYVVWAESGANLGALARQVSQKGFSGLTWAAGIPGTIGGAVFGNAGAHGGEIANSLYLAEILHLINEEGVVYRKEKWLPTRFQFSYRSSVLKEGKVKGIVLIAGFQVYKAEKSDVINKLNEFVEFRKRTQPPGASTGSMFKNPPGDFAGRLIDAAGLKGFRVGDAEISEHHANFFINRGSATAMDIYQLIQVARETVYKKFGVKLELEIELLGEW